MPHLEEQELSWTSLDQRAVDTVRVLARNDAQATVDHVSLLAQGRDFRRELRRVLGVVHQINRRPLQPRARAFAGVM